jgi:hypothetical protein
MTCNAINRRISFTMTLHTESHGVIHFAFGYRLRGHIAVALLAIHSGANVRRVIELHVRRRQESVNTLPRNVLPARAIRRNFPDLWIVLGDHLMTGHAKIHAGNPGVGTPIGAHVAVRALHAVGKMNLVSVSDWLNGRLTQIEKFANGVRDGPVRRREYGGPRRYRWRRRGRDIGLILGRRCSLQQRPSQNNHAKNNGKAKTVFQAEIRQRQITLFGTKLECESDILHACSVAVNGDFHSFILQILDGPAEQKLMTPRKLPNNRLAKQVDFWGDRRFLVN